MEKSISPSPLGRDQPVGLFLSSVDCQGKRAVLSFDSGGLSDYSLSALQGPRRTGEPAKLMHAVVIGRNDTGTRPGRRTKNHEAKLSFQFLHSFPRNRELNSHCQTAPYSSELLERHF